MVYDHHQESGGIKGHSPAVLSIAKKKTGFRQKKTWGIREIFKG